MSPVHLPVVHRGERGVHRAAAFVTQHDEERRAQMQRPRMQRAEDFTGNHVPGDANDEEVAEAGIE